MYMYFLVGIWLLGFMATVVSIILEYKGRKSNKLIYGLGIPGVVSIGSFFAWLIVISLQYGELVYSEGSIAAITFSIIGALVVPLVFDLLAYTTKYYREKFLWTINLSYFITVIVAVCFIYPTVMYFVK